MQKLKQIYEIPIITITKGPVTLGWLEKLGRKYAKLVRWFLTVCEREDWDFRGMGVRRAHQTIKEATYRTDERWVTPYNCKGAIHMPHSHYYDTAIRQAIQKWNSFLTWKDKMRARGRERSQRFPRIGEWYAPNFDATMFNLDLKNGYVVLGASCWQQRQKIPIAIPNKCRYRELDPNKIKSITLVKRGERFVFMLIQNVDGIRPDSETDQHALLVKGVDFGERHLASVVNHALDGQLSEIGVQRVRFHRASEVRARAYREFHIRRKLQSLGKSGQIPRRRDKSANFRRDVVRKLVAREAEDVRRAVANGWRVLIVAGEARTPVPKNRGALSRRLNEFPRAMLREEFYRKLSIAGAEVAIVQENGTSRRCHRCGGTGERPHTGQFVCTNPACNLHKYDADLNAAQNFVGIGLRRLGISKPLGGATMNKHGVVTAPGSPASNGVQRAIGSPFIYGGEVTLNDFHRSSHQSSAPAILRGRRRRSDHFHRTLF